jgi:VCBS repeat-containing protein
MKEIIVQDGQSLFDIALRYYGKVSSVDILLSDNNLTINDDLTAGQVLKIRNVSGNTFNTDTVEFFDKSNAFINNADYIKSFNETTFNNTGSVIFPIIKTDARTVVDKWTVQDGQSVFDIVLQFYGSLEFTEIFLQDNNLSHDDELSSGDIVTLRTDLISLVRDNYVVNNADYIDRFIGVLRIEIVAVGNETIKGSDGYVIVDVRGGTLPYTYFWSNGQTSQNLSNVSVGTYTLIVTDADGGVATITVSIVAIDDKSFLIDENADFILQTDGGRILI